MTPAVPVLASGFASKFDTIGPYVGFASLVAVAAMAILVFTQGRELQRLREWAGTAPERLAELERQLAEQQAQPRVQTLAPHPGAAPPARPAVPATPGAPRPPGVPVTAAASAAGASAAAPAGAAAAPTAGAPGPSAPGAPPAPGTPAGATAAGATPRPTPPRPTPSGGNGAAGQPTRVVPLTSPRPATAAGQAGTAREREAQSGGPNRSIGSIIGVALVLILVLVGLLFAFGVIGGDSTTPVDKANEKARKELPSVRKAPKYSAAATRVVVLNGSGLNGKAKGASDLLDNRRFDMGPAATYSENGATVPQATSTVAYTSGNREAALAIAKILKMRSALVKPMNANVRAAAGGNADVVVVLGADWAAGPGRQLAPSNGQGQVPSDQQLPQGQTGGAVGSGSSAGNATSSTSSPDTTQTPGTTGTGTGTGTGSGGTGVGGQ